MTTTTKIIIGATATILIGGGVWYFIKKRKTPKQPLKKDEEVKQVTKQVAIPKDYSNNELVKKVKDKTDYIHGTLDTMKVVNNKIVDSKNSNPYTVGLLQGVWLIHQREFDKLKGIVNSSKEPKGVKDFSIKLVENLTNRNSTIFNPKEYSYQTQWYKDYLKKKLQY